MPVYEGRVKVEVSVAVFFDVKVGVDLGLRKGMEAMVVERDEEKARGSDEVRFKVEVWVWDVEAGSLEEAKERVKRVLEEESYWYLDSKEARADIWRVEVLDVDIGLQELESRE